MNNKDKKRGNTPLIVTAVICAAVCLATLLVFFLSDVISGKMLMSKTRRNIGKCDVVVLTDFNYDGGILPTSGEAILRDGEARELAGELINATEDISYSNVLNGSVGFWDVSIRFESDGASYTVYLKEDSVYVTKKNKGYLFDIKPSCKDAYGKLYQRVEATIEDQMKD